MTVTNKKYMWVIFAAILMILFISGCSSKNNKKKPQAPDIVTFDSLTDTTKTVIKRECTISKSNWDVNKPTDSIKCDDANAPVSQWFLKSQCKITDTHPSIFGTWYDISCEKTVTGKITKVVPSDNSNKTEFETCQSKGGINCEGCCKSAIFSSNVFTCCAPDSCDERIQMHYVLEGLKNITIEKFPKEKYGVWYGEKNIDFGNRKYVDAEQIDDKIYKFVVDKKEYQFTVTEFGCAISNIQDIQITNQTFGTLFVGSEPANANVYLDGLYRGLTPLTINELSPGVYEVKLSKDGYEDSVSSWSISTGETKNLSISLKK